MEMWRPRLRCTLQHSSHTSTPLLMEAQPGSAGRAGTRVSHSQTWVSLPSTALDLPVLRSPCTICTLSPQRLGELGH